ncbi:hypothetical protein [Rubrivirga marina]|uniref:Uncharacterized protein n=1 Tax=Rubrivirga marina TaxID=1196024 RepID=A0A271IWD4_9BACT|nr:hypothetical protein [Rubrivirga marina]PAP75440.1 hypothetical protein BSZ37_02760 [Rubrivirga marina]
MEPLPTSTPLASVSATAEPTPPTRRAMTFLGRLSKAVREQNWFAVGLEVAIVVLGVVIGFQVTAWGNERAARAQERELLRGLRSELAANVDHLDRVAEEHRRTIRQARRLLAWTGPDPADVPPATMDTLLTALINEIPAYHPAMGEVEAMLGAGHLGLVRDDSLRAMLASWPDVLEQLRAAEDEMRADVLDRFFPYLVERTPLVTADLQVGYIATDRPSQFPQRYDALLSDVAFENHTENRWVMANAILEEGEPVRALLGRMVGRIDRELASAAP